MIITTVSFEMQINMCVRFFSVLILVNFVGTSVLRKSASFQLDIIHYNDFHDRFEETSLLYPICTANDTSCLGGFARLYHEIKTLKNKRPGALVLNAGDVFQGTYWYTLLRWNHTQHFINMLPNDAHAIGNHEFDGGIEELAAYLAGLHDPMLAANLDTSEEPSLKDLIKSSIVIEKKGKKIGIIGVSTVNSKTTSKAGKVNFLDPVAVTLHEAQKLTDEGVNIIIVLSHCGLNIDMKIAKEAGEHVDVIVGGHTHSLLWNGESPTEEKVSGPYPIVLESEAKHGHKVVIVTASAFTKYLGNLTIFFDGSGEMVSFEGQPVFLNRSIPEDPQVKKLLQPYIDRLYQMVHEVVGYANNDFILTSCGSGECAIGNLMADAFLNATREAIPSELIGVGFLLRNMIKGSLSKGEITRGAIINTAPFANRVISLFLPGRYLVQALERCMTITWTEKPFTGPWMPHVAGMQVALNTTSRKVLWIKVKSSDGFVPLQMDQVYHVAAPDFIAYGGNGFTMLSEFGRNATVVGVDAQLVEAYITKHKYNIDANLDQRLTVVS